MSRIHFESVTPVSPDDDASDRARRSRVPVGKAMVLAAMISAASIALAWMQWQVEEPAATLTWAEVTQEARRSQRTIAVVFTRADCVPCVRMRSETFADPAIVAMIARGWILHEVDLDAAGAAELAASFGVREAPTVALAAAGGTPLKDDAGEPLRATGYLDPGAFRDLLARPWENATARRAGDLDGTLAHADAAARARAVGRARAVADTP